MKPTRYQPFLALARLLADDAGAEVIEYALILGLVLVICITTIAAFGTKVLARWTTANAPM